LPEAFREETASVRFNHYCSSNLLRQLTIKNYALIRQLEMSPPSGMTVITGETGAGKSIMLGALGLLLGNRADTKVLWEQEEKCVTEAEFDISSYKLHALFNKSDVDYDDRTVLRREITAAGKSRAFINDTPVTLETMKLISSRLMDIHSQHETLELASSRFQLRLIDAFAGNQRTVDEYEVAWNQYVQLRQKLETLKAEGDALKKESDFIRFQLDELSRANLVSGELVALESELTIQENAEDIKSKINSILSTLSGSEQSASAMLAAVRIQMQSISAFSSTYHQLFERLSSLKIELDDLAGELEHEEAKIEFDPRRLETLNERVDLLNRLLQKHRAKTVEDLIALRDELSLKSGKVTHLDEELESLEKKLKDAQSAMLALADKLSKARAKNFSPLAKQITQLLKELGIPDAQLSVSAEDVPPGPTGKDRVEIFFSANRGIAPRNLAAVASGGEFSRLMFAVKYVMAEKTAMPTLVLDEIDTGISGEVAISMGRLMKEMARRHQLITITHLPQIAAKGDAHYFVFKERAGNKTVTSVKPLEKAERIEEIAKMIGGAKPTTSAIENARELIEQ
jgi:DNA repair protein RecN (Recombination protein N)